MSHASSELTKLSFPGDRSTLVQWGIDTAIANGVNLAPFKAVLVIQNFGVDHGAAGNGILIVDQNSNLCEFGFISHEMGHGFGLPHSWSANPDLEYGDGWDVMSWQTTTFNFQINFRGAQGLATVGLNARNLEALNAVPSGRSWSPAQPDFSEQIILEPLNQLPIGNKGFLVAKLLPHSTRPIRANDVSYTIEFRQKIGWDQGIPQDTLLIHEIRANGLSYLQPTVWGQFTPGQQFVTPEPNIFVRVLSIDSNRGTATLHIWDIPEGSFRREYADPSVYLIENSTKRWVTSPQVLTALGKSWADVRVVPDGALSTISPGADITLD